MKIIVESFLASSEKSGSSIRVRPISGQGFSTNMRVECSKTMRSAFPIGQKFLIYVQIKNCPGKQKHLYSNYKDPWNPISDKDAATFIAKTFTK
jgi:hypothetical protein